jgi:DNA repair photolyase
MTCINGRSRLNQPTLDLLRDRNLVRKVQRALLRGDSKRAIGTRYGLNWRQVDILAAYVHGKEGIQ